MNARSAAVAELAPTGKLRAAINFGNPVLAGRGPASGEPCGISVDLARELARRLDVAIEFVPYDAAGKVVEGLKSQAWDVCFLAIDPLRLIGVRVDFLRMFSVARAIAGVALTIARDSEPTRLRLRSADRSDFLKEPQPQ